MNRIYLDNAASTPVYPEVITEMTKWMTEYYGNPSSIHHFGRTARSVIEEARKIVARHLGASLGEIFFTSGGTEANNMSLKCAVRDLGINRIITSPIEHPSVLNSCQRLAQQSNVKIQMLSVDNQGRPDLQELQASLAENSGKTMVSLMHGNNEIGTMIDLHQVGMICEEAGVLFHTDAVQTVGHFPLNLSELKVTFLSASAHKFHGPKGVGVLYMNADNPISAFMDGGGQERNIRAGTENIPGIRGMAMALEMSCEELSESTRYILELKHWARRQLLKHFPAIRFNGSPDPNSSLYTVLSVTFPPHPKAELLLMNLDIEGISASGGSACSSGAQQGSHVIQAIHPDDQGTTIRLSFSAFNTRAEVDKVISTLHDILD